ncbi:MAG: hypothetical protein V6Z86_06190 [Hyphomicrobiales bacterium]
MASDRIWTITAGKEWAYTHATARRLSYRAANGVRLEDIKCLIRKEIAAVHIPDYCGKELSVELSGRLVNSKQHGRHANAPKIERVGQAFFECQASQASQVRYAEMSVEWIRRA